MTLDIEKIKAAALAATQGEWSTGYGHSTAIFYKEQFIARCGEPTSLENSEYIATANPSAVLELITQLEETQADLAHANSILIKIEKLLEGVEYRGDFAEGVRVLVTQQAAQIEAFKTELKQVDTLRELLVADHVNELAEQAAQIEENLTEIYRLDSGWHEANVKCLEQAARITLLEAAEKDAARWNWMLDRMSGKDVAIFALRLAWRDDYCDEIVADLDKAMEEKS